jgi:hypothetical protein
MNTVSLQPGLIEKQEITNTINQQLQNYVQALAVYEPTALYENCLKVQRIVRELLLATDAVDNFFDYTMLSLELTNEQNLEALNNTRQQISNNIAPETGDRFYTFIQMCASIHQEFLKNGVYDRLPEDAHMYTMQGVLRYFEMRSRYLHATLLLIPHICKGEKQFDFTESLTHLLYPIENNLTSLNDLYFTLIKNEVGITPANDSPTYNTAKFYFNHPVAIQSTDQGEFGQQEYPDVPFAPMPAGRLDAFVNIENTLLKFRLHWAKYAVVDAALYKELEILTQAVKQYYTDEYFIDIPLAEFETIASKLPLLNHFLISRDSNYATAIHAYPPFVVINGQARGTVTTLTDFANLVTLKILHRNKKFQADTQAAFEQKVGKTLERNSFEKVSQQGSVLVASKNNITYTFYLESNPVDVIRTNFGYQQIARLNALRVNCYQKRLNSTTGKQIVISRTPVVTAVANIVSYSYLDDFLANC